MAEESNLKTVRAEAVARVTQYLENLDTNLFKKVDDINIPEWDAKPSLSLNVVAWETEIDCNGTWQKIVVALDKHFPDSLPNIYFPNPPFPLPHVSVARGNHVCYATFEGVALNADNPSGIVVDAIELASQVISDGLARLNSDDFDLEFQRYWAPEARLGELPHKWLSIVKPGGNARTLHLITFEPFLGVSIYLVSEAVDEGILWLERVGRKPKDRPEKLLYLPLTSPIRPPFPQTNKDLYYFLREKARERLVDLLTYMRANKKERVVPLLLSFPVNGRYVFGGITLVRADFSKTKKAIIKGFRNAKIRPEQELLLATANNKILKTAVDRVDKERLQTRVGNINADRLTKRVCIVGCGSIGSKIAQNLALSGVAELLLVDDDILSPENIARHVCPMGAAGQKKVNALTESLLSKMPHMEITPEPLDILDLLDNRLELLEGFDLIISATGDRTTNLRLNEVHQEYFPEIPVMYSWVEAYGFASHAILSVPAKGGCFYCLFNNNQEYRFRLIRTDATRLLETEAGCGSTFMPFGAIDSDIAAAYSSKLSLGALDGKITRGRVWTYIGDIKEAQNMGLELSGEYEGCSFQLIQRLFPRRLTCQKCKH